MKKIKVSTLHKKLEYWQNIVGLRGWDVRIKFEKLRQDEIAKVEACYPVERTAVISVRDDYYKDKDCGIQWNLDTVICHELLHLVFWDTIGDMPKVVKYNKKFQAFEEWICDYFSRVFYNVCKKVEKK